MWTGWNDLVPRALDSVSSVKSKRKRTKSALSTRLRLHPNQFSGFYQRDATKCAFSFSQGANSQKRLTLCNVFAVHWGLLSVLGRYHQCTGGYHDMCGGYHRCIGGISVLLWNSPVH